MTRPPHPARGGSVADAEGGQSREGGPAPRRTGGISARSRARTTWWSSPGCWRAGAPRWWATCAAGSCQMLVTRSATSDGACRSDPTWPAPGRMTRAPWVRWLAAARALLAVCIRVAGATAGQPTITLHWDFICTTCRLRTGWLPMKHRPDGRAVRVIGGGARYRRAGSARRRAAPGGSHGRTGQRRGYCGRRPRGWRRHEAVPGGARQRAADHGQLHRQRLAGPAGGLSTAAARSRSS